jgi:hypothetical protein
MLTPLIVFGSTALANPRPPNLEELSTGLQGFNEGAHFPLPALDETDLQTLLDGEVVRVMERSGTPGRPSRAVGLILSEVPRDQVWVSCQDPHYSQSEQVSEAVLASPAPHIVTWFGLLDLPGPFLDRVWVVDVVDNHELARKTENHAWEHYWDVNPDAETLAAEAVAEGRVPGVDSAFLGRAIFTPTNSGAWLIVDLPGGYSLFGYHSSTELAGSLPTNLVIQFVHAQLGSMLEEIVERGRSQAPSHYNASHGPDVRGGDGAAISRFE